MSGRDFVNFPIPAIRSSLNFENTQYQAALYQARVFAQRADYHKVKADNAARALAEALEEKRMEEEEEKRQDVIQREMDEEYASEYDGNLSVESPR